MPATSLFLGSVYPTDVAGSVHGSVYRAIHGRFKRPSTDPSIHGGPRHRVHARSPRCPSLHRTYTARLQGATRAVYGVVHGVVHGAVYTWLLLLGLHGPDICGVLQLVSVCWLLFCTGGCNCLFPCSLCSCLCPVQEPPASCCGLCDIERVSATCQLGVPVCCKQCLHEYSLSYME